MSQKRIIKTIKIINRKIGEGYPVFIVAEISANHGQNFNRAVRLIKEAKKCKVDAVKFQLYTPDTLTFNFGPDSFKIKHRYWGSKTIYQLYKKAYTPWGWFKKLKRVCDGEGIIFFATAFDKSAVDLLEDINVPVHKISSFELVDIPLIEYVARTKKPLILSTGMATLEEINEAVNAARNAGARQIMLLKCTSSYPAHPEDMNLMTIEHMKKIFKVPVGLSDHSLGTELAVASVAVGASLVEKHFTLSRKVATADRFFSLQPQELKGLVKAIRNTEKALGKISYGARGEERKSLIFRRSLYVVSNIKKGEVFSEDSIRSIRPAFGMKPKYLPGIIGKRASKNIGKGEPLSTEMIV